MTQDEINEIQIYMQLYDKMVISKKTLLGKIGLDPRQEEEEIKKDIEFSNKIHNSV